MVKETTLTVEKKLLVLVLHNTNFVLLYQQTPHVESMSKLR